MEAYHVVTDPPIPSPLATASEREITSDTPAKEIRQQLGLVTGNVQDEYAWTQFVVRLPSSILPSFLSLTVLGSCKGCVFFEFQHTARPIVDEDQPSNSRSNGPTSPRAFSTGLGRAYYRQGSLLESE